MTREATRAAIVAAARASGLDANLVEAVVMTESGGIQSAWNPEPHYRYLVDVRSRKPFRPLTKDEVASERPPKDFKALSGDPDQEWWAQQASWGLMQLMGGVARELGYTHPYLGQLLVDIEDNLRLGCTLLASHLRWANGDVHRALRAYNGGRGGADDPETEPYPLKVEAHLAEIRKARGGQS